MIDRSDKLDTNGDLIYVETKFYQAINLLNLTKGEDRFYSNLGIDFDFLFNNNLTEIVYLKYLLQELGRFGASPDSIQKINSRTQGVLELTMEYSYNIVNYVTGSTLNSKKKLTQNYSYKEKKVGYIR